MVEELVTVNVTTRRGGGTKIRRERSKVATERPPQPVERPARGPRAARIRIESGATLAQHELVHWEQALVLQVALTLAAPAVVDHSLRPPPKGIGTLEQQAA